MMILRRLNYHPMKNFKLLARENLRMVFFVAALGLLQDVIAATYTVTNTNNSGAGSLRQAITDANANAGADIIQFNIPNNGSNTFQTSGAHSWAVITLTSVLPTITGPVLINGFTQPNTNTGFISGRTVGADGIVQADIEYPDVYITRSYGLPANSDNVTGFGFSINTTDVTIQGICISGFGNTNTSGSTASGHAEIGVLRTNTARITNININNCFISCDPRGALPPAARRSKGNGILVCGNNFNGTIVNNYIVHAGTYGIHFNGATDNLNLPGSSNLQNRSWVIEENQIINAGVNANVSGGSITNTFVGDGINTMNCKRFVIRKNYIEDMEQVGIDIGYNADSNYVENNTITGFVKTYAALPMAGIRIGLNSQGDSLVKNLIFGNSSGDFLGGIWIDRSSISTSGITVKDNINNYVGENIIHSNNSSGVVIARNPTGGSVVQNRYNTISRNSIYSNAGLGIDLDYGGTSGPTRVTPNDNADSDGGMNDLQNFPMIDSVKQSGGFIHIWGRGPAGATMEFFGGDGEWNKHATMNLNYGEGKYFIGSGVEGSADDLVAGTNLTNSNIDLNTGNIGTLAMFRFSFPDNGFLGNLDSLTSTATLNRNTSEFGPVAIVEAVLGAEVLHLSALYANEKVVLDWSAMCDNSFSYFAVERSADGTSFTKIGEVRDVVKTGEIKAFDFTDNLPMNGSNYYRLRLISNDASVKYSRVIKVNIQRETRNLLKVSPNPFVSVLNLSLDLPDDGALQIRVSDNLGRPVITRQYPGRKGLNVFDLDGLDKLLKGYYYVEVFQHNRKVTEEKIMKN